MKKVSISKALFVTLVASSIVACGGKKTKGEEEAALAEPELLSIDVSISEDGQSSLALAAASKFSISLEGCASGYSSSADQAKTSINVYKADRSCLAKLNSLEIGGVAYTPSAGMPFSTYKAGDSAVFTNGGSQSIRVTVISQLSSPVLAADAISYSFTQIAEGSSQVITKSVVGAAKSVSVGGQAAPDFKVKSMSFNGIAADGGGEFQFALECNSAISGSGLSALCSDLSMSQLKYVLVKDTYNGVLTESSAAALFASAGSSLAAGDVVAVGAGGMANGGFNSQVLAGPAQMHNNPSMLLVIQGAGVSYLYFNVDVSVLSQSDSL